MCGSARPVRAADDETASSLTRNDRALAPHLEKIVVDYGYTNAETVVHNYWDERLVVRVDNDAVKWIALARPQEKTLLVQSTRAEGSIGFKA
jgi:hypothetical protein